MIRRPPSIFRRYSIEAQCPEIELVDEDIDHPNRIIVINPVFQAFGKKGALAAIRALNEALHPIPHRSARITTPESHEARRFHTTRVQSRRLGDVTFVSAYAQLPT